MNHYMWYIENMSVDVGSSFFEDLPYIKQILHDSISMTYSKFKNLKIEVDDSQVGRLKFTISYDIEGENYSEEIVAVKQILLAEPTHL